MSIGKLRSSFGFAGLCLATFFTAVPLFAVELDEVKRELAAGKAVLLDVREADEWKDGHLRDARLLPLSRIERGVSAKELESVAPNGVIIYLHCAAGARSQTASALLRSTRRDLRPLTQGYDDLLQAGFPKATR